jgi:hypothetical protein
VSQTCEDNAGTCTGPAANGGVWHTGEIGATNLVCDGGAVSQCTNYRVIGSTANLLQWSDLLVTPVMEKVDQTETGGVPNTRIEITQWSWNQAINMADNNLAYTWEFDTDLESLLPLDLFSDNSYLNLGFGGYGAVANENNPELTGGFGVFAPMGTCSGSGGACETNFDCPPGLCSPPAPPNTECFSTSECVAIDPSSSCTAPAPQTCTQSNVSVNGTGGQDRVGKNSCFFEGIGKIPTGARGELGLVTPQDDDLDNDGAQGIDEFVEVNGPYRNHNMDAWNGPDMRFNTLEDFYGDTGNTFQAAIGFQNFEGTPQNIAEQSFGLAVDDVVVGWREFTLGPDSAQCGGGACASVELHSTNLYNGNSIVGITVLDVTPYSPPNVGNNDCPTGTDDQDCNDNGARDVVVKANSEVDVEGVKVICDETAPSSGEFYGTVTTSSIVKSPGVLFVSEQGGDNPTVTVTYDDPDDGAGNLCQNDVDPAKWGVVTSTTTVFLADTCEVNVVATPIRENPLNDNDGFPDSNERIEMVLTVINNCGQQLNNCIARISTNDTSVACIERSIISIGTLEDVPDQQTVPESGGNPDFASGFAWRVTTADSPSPDNPMTATFAITMQCDEIDALSVPQETLLTLDLDLDDGGQSPIDWTEDFEAAGAFGVGAQFRTENLDAGIPGGGDIEGLQNGQGYRCTYSDPEWPNSGSYGSPEAATCYPAMNLAQSNAVFWGRDGSTVGNFIDGGRAHTSNHSLYYGIFLASPVAFTTPMATLESVRTIDPINLGVGNGACTGNGVPLACCTGVGEGNCSPQLRFWHQVSLLDDRNLGAVPVLRSADRGVVQLQLADSDTGVATGDWIQLTPFQNVYDEQAVDNYFNCMFDPTDDGNTEDTYFDPADPDRRLGPSSTCFPDFTFGYLGDTDQGFNPTNIGNADTPPPPLPTPSLGTGTWVESKVDLSAFRGRRVRLRYLVSSLKATQENWEAQFMLNPSPNDDGWWIDNIAVSGTLTNPVDVVVDTTNNAGLGTCPVLCAGGTTVNVEVNPGELINPALVLTDAPGQPINVNAVTSVANDCLSGGPQYQFEELSPNPGIIRQYTDDPVIDLTPQVDTTYVVRVRCSSTTGQPACESSRSIVVDVACPTTCGLGALPDVDATATHFQWSTTRSTDYEVWRGRICRKPSDGAPDPQCERGLTGQGNDGVVSDFDAVAGGSGSLLGPFVGMSHSHAGDGITNTGTNWDGYYYLFRSARSIEFCNDPGGLWASGWAVGTPGAIPTLERRRDICDAPDTTTGVAPCVLGPGVVDIHVAEPPICP